MLRAPCLSKSRSSSVACASSLARVPRTMPTDAAADAGPFSGLRAFLELGPRLHVTKVALAGLVGHHDADVVILVAMPGCEVVIGVPGAFGTVVQPGHEVLLRPARAPRPRRARRVHGV